MNEDLVVNFCCFLDFKWPLSVLGGVIRQSIVSGNSSKYVQYSLIRFVNPSENTKKNLVNLNTCPDEYVDSTVIYKALRDLKFIRQQIPLVLRRDGNG